MKFCSTCYRHSRVCKIYFRFKNYNEDFHRNHRCNVRVTENKWKKFKTEKFKFCQEVDDTLAAQEKTRKIKDKIVFDYRVTLIKKLRFRQQMNLLKKRIDKIIILKETQIVEENSFMNFDPEDSTPFLHFDLFIWNALDELLNFF